MINKLEIDILQPDYTSEGLPLCSENNCLQYDGKRCKLLGFQPNTICEPRVLDLISELKEYKHIISKKAKCRYSVLPDDDIVFQDLDKSLYGFSYLLKDINNNQDIPVYIIKESYQEAFRQLFENHVNEFLSQTLINTKEIYRKVY